MAALTTADQLEIQALSACYFYALDGLHTLAGGEPSENWVKTFTPDGTFAILQSSGERLLEVSGAEALLQAYHSFTDVETTRHWVNNLWMAGDAGEVRSGCYIIAMNIQTNPAMIIRTGVYQDHLVQYENRWRFFNRTLILDPYSPAA
jgi:hypothetical protein